MSAAQSESAPWTVARLLSWTRQHFEKHGLESPRLCAEILLAHAMGCERVELYTRFQSVPGEEVFRTYRHAVREAALGRPIAYVTGSREFFSLRFEVTPDVLIPRPETEVLVERTISLVRAAGQSIGSILDVGTGSGCIAVSLARHLPGVRICASDISAAAVRVAQRNVERHGVQDRVELRVGDLFEPWEPHDPFDVIVSNPPYVADSEAASLPANVRGFEPGLALFAGDDGLSVVRRLVGEAPAHLAPGGHFLTEVAFNRSPAVRELLNAGGWSDIVTYRDALRHERVVHARCRTSERTSRA